MNIKLIILAISLLSSLSCYSQAVIPDSTDKPILGYYHLGMSYEEHFNQASKMKETTEITNPNNSLSQYLIGIDGINFNAANTDVSSCLDISEYDYANYSKETLPIYFTGKSYFLDGKLVSMTIQTPWQESDMRLPTYAASTIFITKKVPQNRCLLDVYHVNIHNNLIEQAEMLVSFLSKKYGTPTKEYTISKLEPLKQGETSCAFPTQWYSLCQSNAVLPRAEWHQGKMTIIMGISSDATLFISFLDEQALSHSNLDRYFKPAEPTKANATW